MELGSVAPESGLAVLPQPPPVPNLILFFVLKLKPNLVRGRPLMVENLRENQ